jgi:hypothetical protein
VTAPPTGLFQDSSFRTGEALHPGIVDLGEDPIQFSFEILRFLSTTLFQPMLNRLRQRWLV